MLQLSEGRGGEGSGGGGPAAQERAWEESYCVGEGDKTEEVRERGGRRGWVQRSSLVCSSQLCDNSPISERDQTLSDANLTFC